MSSLQRVHFRLEGRTHERIECAPEDADLVSSLLPDGRHAPVFDIDMPATLQRFGSEDPAILDIDGKCTDGKMTPFLSRTIFQGIFHRDAWDCFDDAWRSAQLLGAESFGYPTLRTLVPTSLLPSSTPGHFHLLLDAPMSWSDFEDLLECAEYCGLIAKEYELLCKRHGKGFLWLPGKKRAWLRRIELQEIGPEARLRKMLEDWPSRDPYGGW